MLPDNLLYTKEHEWIKKDGDIITVGISDYAQEELGDITFVELPGEGASVSYGDSPVTLESVKAVSSVYAPADGEITGINSKLEDEPELINSSPFDEGWIFKMKLKGDLAPDLLSAGDYQEFIDSLD